jgi:predicted secreted protein
MPKSLGRNILVYRGSGATRTPFAGGREDKITFGDEQIDVTDKFDAGVRVLHPDSAMIFCDIAMTGLLAGPDVLALATATNNRVDDFEIEIDTYGTITGQFRFGASELDAPYDGPAQFNITLNSTGPYTFTPAP